MNSTSSTGKTSMDSVLRVSLLLAIAVGGALVAGSAEAAPIFAEPFAYTTGDLNGQGGWGGSTNWDVESGNLSYPAAWNMTTTGNRATINGGGSSVTRSLGSSMSFDDPGTYYVSFLISKDATSATSSEYFWMSLRDSTSYKATMGIGSGENVLLGEATGGGSFSVSSGTISGSTDYVYVAKIITSGIGNDQYFAKLYEPSDPVPVLEPTSWDVTRSPNVTGTASYLRLESGSVAQFTIDEILIGTSWADVAAVPEPSTLAMLLMGLGAAGVLFGRRR